VSDVRRLLYVALGDSMSCATEPGRKRTWPELVTELLGHGVAHTNLATVGATSEKVERTQLPLAIALQPDVVTIICGANYVIESVRPDVDRFAECFDRMLSRLRAGLEDSALVTATYPDLAGAAGFRPRTIRRLKRAGDALNARIRELADLHGVVLLDWAVQSADDDPENRGRVGLHPSAEAQREIAADVVRALRDLGIGEA
jgi:lysophospholipase L1-like esterase